MTSLFCRVMMLVSAPETEGKMKKYPDERLCNSWLKIGEMCYTKVSKKDKLLCIRREMKL